MNESIVMNPIWVSGIDYSQIKKYVKRCYERYRTRQHLAKLPEERLADIGLTAEQVKAELKKPFWH